MNLYITSKFHPHEEHPRDMLWFDVYADPHAYEDSILPDEFADCVTTHMTLLLEKTYMNRSQQKSFPLSSDSIEAKTISALRDLARTATSSPLIHAYRCLATCLENYARYGGENAIARVLALAFRLRLQHSSKPYRTAFDQAYSELNLILASQESVLPAPDTSSAKVPDSVFYTLVLHTSSTPLQAARIRLFQSKADAIRHLSDMLGEYGVPYEVWRSLRSAMADELLPYAQDDLFFSMGEKKVIV